MQLAPFQHNDATSRSPVVINPFSIARANASNPDHQLVISNIRGNFDPKMNQVLILHWLTIHNLPFHVINTDEFRRILKYNNPFLETYDILTSTTLCKLLEAEYDSALNPVKRLLQTARNKIHFRFDGWTSRRNRSFLGIHAYFIDKQ